MSVFSGLFRTKPALVALPSAAVTSFPVPLAVDGAGRVLISPQPAFDTGTGPGDITSLPVQTDGVRRLVVVPPVGLWSHTTTSTYRRVVKPSAGSLQFFFGCNERITAQWLMFFDATAYQATGANPLFAATYIPANTNFSLVLGDPLPFSSGLVWQASSTKDTLTVDTSGTLSVSAEYY